jgi:hypothetical protein
MQGSSRHLDGPLIFSLVAQVMLRALFDCQNTNLLRILPQEVLCFDVCFPELGPALVLVVRDAPELFARGQALQAREDGAEFHLVETRKTLPRHRVGELMPGRGLACANRREELVLRPPLNDAQAGFFLSLSHEFDESESFDKAFKEEYTERH